MLSLYIRTIKEIYSQSLLFEPLESIIQTMEKGKNSQFFFIILIGVAIWFIFGKTKTDTYRPVYYPNKNDLSIYIRGTKFSSLEDAREWAYQQYNTRQDKNWDYEIGKNCKPSKYGDIEVCEETLQ